MDPVDLQGKDCPCAAEYTCDPRTNTCIIGNATGGAAGASSGGSAGSGGAGGLAGSAGTGGAPNDASSDGKPADAGAGGNDAKADGADSGVKDAAGGDAGKNSCVGHCNLSNVPVPGSSPPCFCDSLCEGYKDCCPDKIAVCGKAPADAGADGPG